MDDDAVVGKLVRLWSWAELNRIDPNDLGVTKEFIDKIVGRKGFALALEKTGWLIETDGKLSFRNFKRHNSPVAQNKALTAKRVARHRLRKAAVNEKVTKKPLAEKAAKTPKNEEVTVPFHHVEEVIIADSYLVISEEEAAIIEPEVAEDVSMPAEPVTEALGVVDEPETPSPEVTEAAPEPPSEEVAVEAPEAPPGEITVETPEAILEEVPVPAPIAIPEEVTVDAPVEEPTPRKRRGKTAPKNEDQPLLF
ncbi:MAG: hypothetical protein K9N47_16655 [Prosthecobacter sp.]|uniref:hypothetical protein n=1 Tax=Prosthecobacter sp. TaxID=1965333 RepID=UPI0025E901C3|nr:hypothetical protein [Prosthecobacter sp.]MCF7787763.1 hypothetical protein [Prosthecobacter sp.]